MSNFGFTLLTNKMLHKNNYSNNWMLTFLVPIVINGAHEI